MSPLLCGEDPTCDLGSAADGDLSSEDDQKAQNLGGHKHHPLSKRTDPVDMIQGLSKEAIKLPFGLIRKSKANNRKHIAFPYLSLKRELYGGG
ncbi:hypothetical protein NC651_017580 [Populus alba x Populus x berolinensis]|nr:hypothetical protein NC651_017580 [Populus alba x Populus x berolinensis]